MQASAADSLRHRWGGKPCAHPELDKEYYLGSQTGDLVCTTCGALFLSREEAAADAARQRAEGNLPPPTAPQ